MQLLAIFKLLGEISQYGLTFFKSVYIRYLILSHVYDRDKDEYFLDRWKEV